MEVGWAGFLVGFSLGFQSNLRSGGVWAVSAWSLLKTEKDRGWSDMENGFLGCRNFAVFRGGGSRKIND